MQWISRMMGGGGETEETRLKPATVAKETFDASSIGEGIGVERWEEIRKAWNAQAENTDKVETRKKDKLDIPGITEVFFLFQKNKQSTTQ